MARIRYHTKSTYYNNNADDNDDDDADDDDMDGGDDIDGDDGESAIVIQERLTADDNENDTHYVYCPGYVQRL